MPTQYALERYLNIRSANAPTFSPDGQFVAFLSNITGVPQVWQLPITSGWPTQLTFSTEPVRGVEYHPLRHQLLYSMDTGGNERNQLYMLTGTAGNTDHGLGDGWDSTDISRDPKAIHSFGGFSHDGKSIAFSANRTDASRFDIYNQKLDGNATLITKGPGGYYSPLGWSPDDTKILVHRLESNFNGDLYSIDTRSGDVQHLTPHKGDAQFDAAVWAPDGKSIYCVSTADGRDLPALAQLDISTGKVTYIEKPEHEVESVQFSSKGRWMAWLLNVDGRSQLQVRDLKANKTITLPKLPLGVISGLAFSPDESKLAFVVDGAQHNPDVWLIDLLHPAKATQLTFSSRAGLPSSSFVEPELVRYPSFDGKMIPAWFYRPVIKDGKLPPVIVYPHGGPESQTRPAFSALFQYFVSRGYGIFAPNVRGSSGYGTAYMNLDNVRLRMDSVKDLAHGAMWLGQQKRADPKRLAVYGGSYGGFMVLASVTNYPDLWAAGIDVVGICNFVTFLEKTGAYRRAHREKEYGSLENDRDFLVKISPLHHVDQIKCPMMVIHGANDPRVPIDEAEQVVAALKHRKVPVEYLRYEDEGHGLAKLKNRLDAYPKMVAFLDKHLGGEGS